MINSKYALIANNYFYNVTQVTTTHPWSDRFGGTHDITFKNNTFESLKGGLKLATKKPVNKALIEDNKFYNNKGTALELVYYSDVNVINNQFKDSQGFIANIYPNSAKILNHKFNWGNINFSYNQINKAKAGLRIQSDVKGELIDSDQVKGINITNNIFKDVDLSQITEEKYKFIILFFSVGNKMFTQSQVTHNQYNLFKGTQFIRTVKNINVSHNQYVK